MLGVWCCVLWLCCAVYVIYVCRACVCAGVLILSFIFSVPRRKLEWSVENNAAAACCLFVVFICFLAWFSRLVLIAAVAVCCCCSSVAVAVVESQHAARSAQHAARSRCSK